MKMINGQTVPENLSLPELVEMMGTSDVQIFAVACEALRLANTQQAYEVLKKHISVADKYKFRCILEVIFDYSSACELVCALEYALQSEEMFLVKTALNNIIQGKVRVADEQVLACIEKNHHKLDSYSYRVLTRIKGTSESINRILNLYHTCKEDSCRVVIAECLYHFCSINNYLQLFALFESEDTPHIRILACRIAKDYNRADLLQKFTHDKDGHIRKLVLS